MNNKWEYGPLGQKVILKIFTSHVWFWKNKALAINEIACLILLKAVGWIFIDVANPIKLKDTIFYHK